MGKEWRTAKVRRPRADFEAHAALLASEMPEGIEWHFGGSWRRGAPEVGDLDIVVVTESGLLESTLLDQGVALPSSVVFQRKGGQIAQGDLTVGDITVHVDFWACTPAQRGAFLWFITGPKELNIAMRAEAIRQGMHLSQIGLLDSEGNQLDDGTERGVAELLDWAWLEPEDRSKWQMPSRAATVIEVVGSKGDIHSLSVAKNGRAFSCTCPGFKFRRRCRHVTEHNSEVFA